MMRIVIICLLLSLVNSQNCILDETQLANLTSKIYEAVKIMNNTFNYEDAAIFIGTARSGKSTLINYLIGTQLNATRLTKWDRITIEKLNASSSGPDIGSGLTSTTKVPSKWTSTKLPDLVLWDTAGFDDNRGPVRDITNSFYLYELVKTVKSLKFVVITNFNDIVNDSPKKFFDLLNSLETFFGSNFETLFPSISVVFSRAPKIRYSEIVNSDYITKKLNESFLLEENLTLSPAIKRFFQYLINHGDRIGFFWKMTTPGRLLPQMEENIVRAIKTSTSVQTSSLGSLKLTLSKPSRICLYNTRDKLLSLSQLSDLQTTVFEVFNKKIFDLSTLDRNADENRIRTFQSNFIAIKKTVELALNNKDNPTLKFDSIKSVDLKLRNQIDDNNIETKYGHLRFVDNLLQTSLSKQFDLFLDTIISIIDSQIDKMIFSIDQMLGIITSENYEQKIKDIKETQNQKIANLTAEMENLNNQKSDQASVFLELIKQTIINVREFFKV